MERTELHLVLWSYNLKGDRIVGEQLGVARFGYLWDCQDCFDQVGVCLLRESYASMLREPLISLPALTSVVSSSPSVSTDSCRKKALLLGVALIFMFLWIIGAIFNSHPPVVGAHHVRRVHRHGLHDLLLRHPVLLLGRATSLGHLRRKYVIFPYKWTTLC